MAIVKNHHGVEIDFDAAAVYMDYDICEDLHRELAPCTEQEFFEAYALRHAAKFGEEFELNKENPNW